MDGQRYLRVGFAGYAIMPKRGFDVCLLILFLGDLVDSGFDSFEVLRVPVNDRGIVKFPLVMSFECEFGDYTIVVASSLDGKKTSSDFPSRLPLWQPRSGVQLSPPQGCLLPNRIDLS